jgi:hypothetical protein
MKGAASWLTAPFEFASAIRNIVRPPEHAPQMNLILSGAVVQIG